MRRAAGEEPKPTVAIVDGRTVEEAECSAPNGWDGGRKRFIAVDAPGLTWAPMVMPADVQDRDSGPPLMDRLRQVVERMKVVRGESHFDAALAHGWVMRAWVGVAVRKLAGQAGFEVQT